MNPEPTPRVHDPRQADLFGAPPPRASGTPPRVAFAPSPEPSNYWDYCPNCSARLHTAGCKYRCPRCHYFLSCSDYD